MQDLTTVSIADSEPVRESPEQFNAFLKSEMSKWSAIFRDAGIKAGFLNAWHDRRNWGPRARWQFEGICMMSCEKILRCGEFIDRAAAKS